MTPEEVSFFSQHLADVIVAAVRTTPRLPLLPWRRQAAVDRQRERLALLRGELVETFAGALTLLAHDTENPAAEEGALVLDLNARLTRDGEWSVKA